MLGWTSPCKCFDSFYRINSMFCQDQLSRNPSQASGTQYHPSYAPTEQAGKQSTPRGDARSATNEPLCPGRVTALHSGCNSSSVKLGGWNEPPGTCHLCHRLLSWQVATGHSLCSFWVDSRPGNEAKRGSGSVRAFSNSSSLYLRTSFSIFPSITLLRSFPPRLKPWQEVKPLSKLKSENERAGGSSSEMGWVGSQTCWFTPCTAV